MKALSFRWQLLIIIACIVFVIVGWNIWIKQRKLKETTKNPIAGQELSPQKQTKQAVLAEGTELTLKGGSQKSANIDVQVSEETPLEVDDEQLNKFIEELLRMDTEQEQQDKSTAQVDERAYYAPIDREMNNGLPLDMIGIPRLQDNSTALIFKPTEADRQRLQEIEEEMEDARDLGILSLGSQDGYVAVNLGENAEPIYVRPDYLASFQNLWKEHNEIRERSMRTPLPSEAQSYLISPKKHKKFTDGTELEYYRRRDGALIRSIRKPDGTVRKWVIGWVDLSVYPQLFEAYWRNE